MSKSPTTTHSLNLLVKFSFVAIAGLVGQSALAKCPVANATGFNVEALNIGTSGKTIFFCKQEVFSLEQLSYAPKETELVTGGSRAISQRNTVQTFPMSTSVNLSGFSVIGDPLNALIRDFPNAGGQYNKKSLFNFYTRADDESNCPAEYTRMKNYLRTHANMLFTFIGLAQTTSFIEGIDPSIGTINNVKLAPTVGTGQLTASVELYHTNPGPGQFFNIKGGPATHCWLGVGARLRMDNADLKNSGSFILRMGVNTK